MMTSGPAVFVSWVLKEFDIGFKLFAPYSAALLGLLTLPFLDYEESWSPYSILWAAFTLDEKSAFNKLLIPNR